MKVRCERLDYFGRGVGHIDGKVIFIYDLLPSEEAIIDIVLDKKNYMIGEVKEYLVKSDSRVKPKCIYKRCGCHINVLSYFNTLEFKKRKVLDILKRFCNVDLDLKIIASDNIYGYRNKITLKVRDGRLGYFKNGSNELIEIDKCLIVSDKINEVIRVLKKQDLSLVKEVIIKDFGEVMLFIDGVINIDKLKSMCASIYMDGKVCGKSYIVGSLDKYKFLISKDSFFQVNNNVCLKMYNQVLDYAGYGDTALDLFCGSGTISTFLSNNFKKVIGCDINESSIECAKESLKLNGIDNIEFICGDANKIVCDCDCLVVDPARSGLSNDGIANIIKIKPKKIVYVSCNIMSFARDFNKLSRYYDFKNMTLFDMFPWTYHVECVALLCLKTFGK